MQSHIKNFLKKIPFIRGIYNNLKSTFHNQQHAPPATFSLGKYSYYHPSLIVKSPQSTIGNFTSIAGGVILGLSQHPLNCLTTSPIVDHDRFMSFPQKKYPSVPNGSFTPVTVGHDVWIGEAAKVMGGLTIGHGAVIGAGAIVTKNVPPYAIVGGVPAKIIRYRFSEQIIEDLLALQWWDLEDSIIATLPMDNIDACVMELKKIRGVA